MKQDINININTKNNTINPEAAGEGNPKAGPVPERKPPEPKIIAEKTEVSRNQ